MDNFFEFPRSLKSVNAKLAERASLGQTSFFDITTAKGRLHEYLANSRVSELAMYAALKNAGKEWIRICRMVR